MLDFASLCRCVGRGGFVYAVRRSAVAWPMDGQVLYSARRVDRFDAREFLDAVCANASLAFDKTVNIEIAEASGELSNDAAMPLALILNELLTNAVKCGVKGREEGNIRFGLSRGGDGSWQLYVHDRGPGFDFEEARWRSSGLGLVMGLARQLGGRLVVERARRARCVVRDYIMATDIDAALREAIFGPSISMFSAIV